MLLQEIYDRGLNDSQIAARIDAPQASVNRLRKGIHKSCGYERGLKIAALHKEVCGALPQAAETGAEAAP